jgi:hypothetical protein
LPWKAPIAAGTGVGAHRERHGIHRLERGCGLTASAGKAVVSDGFALPQIGRLADTQARGRERGKAVAGMLGKGSRRGLCRSGVCAVRATDFHRHDRGVAQFRGNAGVADAVGGASLLQRVIYQTILRTVLTEE